MKKLSIISPVYKAYNILDELVSGIIWRNISFNAISPILSKEKLEFWLPRYFQYFNVNHIPKLPHGKYLIYVKEIEIPTNWKKDFLREQIVKPWIFDGEYSESEYSWTEEMQLIFEKESSKK
jgi:hypothetical protein